MPPPNNYTAPPTHVLPRSRLFYNNPLTADTNFWLVVTFNVRTAATEGQDPAPLSNFLMGRFLVPQAREPAAVIANPPPGACCGPLGSRGAKIWGRHCPTYGERAKLLEGRWRWLILIVVCCGGEKSYLRIVPQIVPKTSSKIAIFEEVLGTI